ncbi:hypothetical protein ACFQZ4_35200 [Catellatospora coxensis]
MRDGMPRAFRELNADFPAGIELVAVPMRAAQNKIVGAVLLEYTRSTGSCWPPGARRASSSSPRA